MLSGGLIGDLGEAADQLLEHQAHLVVVHQVGVQLDVGEALGDLVEEPSPGQAIHLGEKVEALEDVAHVQGEALDVAFQVAGDMVLIAHQPLHVER